MGNLVNLGFNNKSSTCIHINMYSIFFKEKQISPIFAPAITIEIFKKVLTVFQMIVI